MIDDVFREAESARPRAPAPLGGACRWQRRPDSRGAACRHRGGRQDYHHRRPHPPHRVPLARCVLLPRGGFREAREWVTQRIERTARGADPVQVAAGMRRSATLRQIEQRKPVDRCADYMQELAPYMHYGRAISRDSPSRPASSRVPAGISFVGASTSAARDGAPRVPAILLLRALVLSGDLAEYWAFHEQQVFARTHELERAGRVRTPGRPPKGQMTLRRADGVRRGSCRT